MNVIVGNELQSQLSNLDVDIIKNISGVYEPIEIVEMFKNFFYSKMILDVTSIRNYGDVNSYRVIAQGLDVEKIIFLLPEGSPLCTATFLTELISLGIYNFTTNIEGVKYLLKKSNKLKDVQAIQKMGQANMHGQVHGQHNTLQDQPQTSTPTARVDQTIIIGIRNITEHAGATTLIYMLKKELTQVYGKDRIVAIEVGKGDFQAFYDPNMISIKEGELKQAINRHMTASVILVDLNNSQEENLCSDIYYLLEPSTLKVNKLIRKNRTIFAALQNKKIVLNKSMLINKEVMDFEGEANIKILYNMPPLDERKRNAIITDFLTVTGLIGTDKKAGSNKIFGLFRL